MKSWTSANSMCLQPRRHGSIKGGLANRSRKGIFRFSSTRDPTWSAVFCSGVLITRKIQTCWSESIGGRKDGESAGAPLLLRQSERAGVIHTEKRRLLGNLIAAYQYFEGACEKEGEQLFARADSNRIRGNHFKLKEDGFRLEVRKFFTHSVVRH